MAIAATDVGILDVTLDDNDFTAGKDINVEVRAEVGTTLFDGLGAYRVVLTMTSLTNPAQLDKQTIKGNYKDANWPKAGRNTFKFTVPGAKTAGRADELVEAQAVVIGGSATTLDGSFTASDEVLLTE
jgi:hypothetical protein